MSELLQVRVKTEAAKDVIREIQGILYVSVVDAPKHNSANKKVISLVCTYTKAKRVMLISGHHRANKTLKVQQ
jgi:uncharacterized protein YggU (UPF0235/DUF167 family)